MSRARIRSLTGVVAVVVLGLTVQAFSAEGWFDGPC